MSGLHAMYSWGSSRPLVSSPHMHCGSNSVWVRQSQPHNPSWSFLTRPSDWHVTGQPNSNTHHINLPDDGNKVSWTHTYWPRRHTVTAKTSIHVMLQTYFNNKNIGGRSSNKLISITCRLIMLMSRQQFIFWQCLLTLQSVVLTVNEIYTNQISALSSSLCYHCHYAIWGSCCNEMPHTNILQECRLCIRPRPSEKSPVSMHCVYTASTAELLH